MKEENPLNLFSRTEAAKALKIGETTLWRWTKEGHVKSFKVGSKVYYKKEDLEKSLIEIPPSNN